MEKICMINQSASNAAFSRDLRRLAAKSEGSSKVRSHVKGKRRGGGGCCILLIIIVVALIAYAYIDGYILQPRKKSSSLGINITYNAVQKMYEYTSEAKSQPMLDDNRYCERECRVFVLQENA
jgi:hypothetical protein